MDGPHSFTDLVDMHGLCSSAIAEDLSDFSQFPFHLTFFYISGGRT